MIFGTSSVTRSGSKIRKKHFRLQERDLLLQEHNLVMWPLHNATSSFARTSGRERNIIRRLTSVSRKKCRGTERRISPVVYNFIILFCGVCALRVPFFLVNSVKHLGADGMVQGAIQITRLLSSLETTRKLESITVGQIASRSF